MENTEPAALPRLPLATPCPHLCLPLLHLQEWSQDLIKLICASSDHTTFLLLLIFPVVCEFQSPSVRPKAGWNANGQPLQHQYISFFIKPILPHYLYVIYIIIYSFILHHDIFYIKSCNFCNCFGYCKPWPLTTVLTSIQSPILPGDSEPCIRSH